MTIARVELDVPIAGPFDYECGPVDVCVGGAEAEHLVSARNNEEGVLVIAMDSPAWATRVRYRARELWRRPVRITVVPRSRR